LEQGLASHDKYDRIFRILEHLARQDAGQSLSEIAAATDIPVSSCHGVLKGLLGVDALALDDGRNYTLGKRSRGLSAIFANSEQVIPLCRKELPTLTDEFGFDIYIAQRSGDQVIYVERGFGTRPVNVNVRLGMPLDLHATSVGKLFAALESDLSDKLLHGTEPLRKLTNTTIVDRGRLSLELERIRKRGYSVTNGESIRGVAGLAVPVCDSQGGVLAAIHLSALGDDLNAELKRKALDSLRAAASRVAAQVS
jgi:DNA-binding IclR family transcriptional regulator